MLKKNKAHSRNFQKQNKSKKRKRLCHTHTQKKSSKNPKHNLEINRKKQQQKTAVKIQHCAGGHRRTSFTSFAFPASPLPQKWLWKGSHPSGASSEGTKEAARETVGSVSKGPLLEIVLCFLKQQHKHMKWNNLRHVQNSD